MATAGGLFPNAPAIPLLRGFITDLVPQRAAQRSTYYRWHTPRVSAHEVQQKQMPAETVRKLM